MACSEGSRAADLRAIVHPAKALDHFTLDRWPPPAGLSRFVDRIWRTAWDLPEPFVQPIVTFPAVNFVIQADGSAMVSGVQRATDERQLSGVGWALGVMFRTGGFRPFISEPMTSLVDRRVAARDLFGPAADRLAERVVGAASDATRIELLGRFFLTRAPASSTVGEQLSTLVESAVRADPPLTRVDDLARSHGVSVRTLQRLFAEHVGVGPKLVLDRLRVQLAAELARRPATSWADAAHRLGYADQAHLTTDLSTIFGAPPAAYARRESAEWTGPAVEPRVDR